MNVKSLYSDGHIHTYNRAYKTKLKVFFFQISLYSWRNATCAVISERRERTMHIYLSLITAIYANFDVFREKERERETYKLSYHRFWVGYRLFFSTLTNSSLALGFLNNSDANTITMPSRKKLFMTIIFRQRRQTKIVISQIVFFFFIKKGRERKRAVSYWL